MALKSRIFQYFILVLSLMLSIEGMAADNIIANRKYYLSVKAGPGIGGIYFDEKEGNIISGKADLYNIQNRSERFAQREHLVGVSFNAALGVYITPNFAVEFEFMQHPKTSDKIYFGYHVYPLNGSADLNIKDIIMRIPGTIYTASINAKFFIGKFHNTSLFLIGGIGPAKVKGKLYWDKNLAYDVSPEMYTGNLDKAIKDAAIDDLLYNRLTKLKIENAMAFNVGFGVQQKLRDNLHLTLEYRRFQLNKLKFTNALAIYEGGFDMNKDNLTRSMSKHFDLSAKRLQEITSAPSTHSLMFGLIMEL